MEVVMHERSIDILNRVVRDELSAVHQYMYFHFHCDDQGYDLLASLFKRTAIEEMLHVENAAERILFLEGDVDMKTAEDAQQIHDVREMLQRAAQMEKDSAKEYNEWANEVGAANDAATKRLLEKLIDDEERHYDQYTQEIANLERFGEKYLALQSIERSKSYSEGGES
jgi:bacterioferritin